MAQAHQAVNQLLSDALLHHASKEGVKDECLKVESCDGSDPTLVKMYIRDINLVDDNLRFVVLKRTERDSLYREVLRYRATHPQHGWGQMRTHLLSAFVSQDTEGVIKRELVQIRRSPFETIVSYNRRFRM